MDTREVPEQSAIIGSDRRLQFGRSTLGRGFMAENLTWIDDCGYTFDLFPESSVVLGALKPYSCITPR